MELSRWKSIQLDQISICVQNINKNTSLTAVQILRTAPNCDTYIEMCKNSKKRGGGDNFQYAFVQFKQPPNKKLG